MSNPKIYFRCDAKGIFFSGVEVLRARQSNRPCAAVFHVSLIVGVVVPVAVPWLVLVLFAQNAYFCFSMCIRFAWLFFSIYSNPSFHMHVYQCFVMLYLAAHFVAARGLVVGLCEGRDSVLTECTCR